MTRQIKSIGNSTTTAQNLLNARQVKAVLYDLAEQVARRLREQGLYARGIQLSVKRSNLESYQRSDTLALPAADSKSLFDAAFNLYLQAHEEQPVRALGLRAERLCPEGSLQVSLFGGESQVRRAEKLERTMDLLCQRYGNDALRHAHLQE